jgi:hypothetical protein
VVPPCSDRIARAPPYSSPEHRITCTGLSPATAGVSNPFHLSQFRHWPGPRSLATTSGVSVDVLSSGYLDVSVPRVRFFTPILFRARYPLVITGYSNPVDTAHRRTAGFEYPAIEGGFPHSEIDGSKAVRTSPSLIAAYHVLHRLLPPRHPPDALRSLDRSH